MSRVLENLQRDLELEGYSPGTEAFDVVLRERKVELCLQMRGVDVCSKCIAYMDCELVRAHRRDVAFGRRRKKVDVVMGRVRKPS